MLHRVNRHRKVWLGWHLFIGVFMKIGFGVCGIKEIDLGLYEEYYGF